MEICSLVPSKIAGEPTTVWQKKHWALLSDENAIKGMLGEVQVRFLQIAYRLLDIRDSKSYSTAPAGNGRYCNSVFEYTEKHLGFSKTFAFNLIQVAEKFSDGRRGLKSEYQGYGLSQLAELVSVPAPLHKYFCPEMTVKDIRTVKSGRTVGLFIDGKYKSFSILTSEFLKVTLTEPIPTSEQKKVVRAEQKIDTVSIAAKSIQKVKASQSGMATFFKNDEERSKFLRDYDKWPVWIEVPELKLKVRRMEFTNGAVFLVYARDGCTYAQEYAWFDKPSDVVFGYFDNCLSHYVEKIRQEKLGAWL